MALLTDYFGVVARDASYEFNTNPAYPDGLNQAFLGSQFNNIAALGAGWLRFEFHVEWGDSSPSGSLDYRKTDWFVVEANRCGIKLLALVGSGTLKNTLKDLNLPADKADGTNAYIRAYVDRIAEIYNRYPGGQIAAWEILNEPNVSAELYNETGGKQQEVSPERFATLLAKVRRKLDALGNRAPVLIGGLLKGVPIENTTRYTTDFLESLYTSKPIGFYTKSEKHFPWDGVCIHPYPDLSNRTDPALQTYTFLQQMYAVMTKYKEPGRIWITEIGWEAEPSLDPTTPPSSAEQKQLDYMRSLLDLLLPNMSSAIARFFWFKLEDFSINGQQYNNWGLVRLKPGSNDVRMYSPGGEAVRYKPAFSLLRSYINAGASTPNRPT